MTTEKKKRLARPPFSSDTMFLMGWIPLLNISKEPTQEELEKALRESPFFPPEEDERRREGLLSAARNKYARPVFGDAAELVRIVIADSPSAEPPKELLERLTLAIRGWDPKKHVEWAFPIGFYISEEFPRMRNTVDVADWMRSKLVDAAIRSFWRKADNTAVPSAEEAGVSEWLAPLAFVAYPPNGSYFIGCCPRCRKVFEKKRGDQEYCGSACKAASTQKRYYDRKKHC